MKRFTQLFIELDSSNKTSDKLAALKRYLTEAPDEDKVWAIGLLTGKRPRRPIKTTLLRQWAADQAGLPEWLFEESYHIVGDLAETISLILPPNESGYPQSLSETMAFLIDLREAEEADQLEAITRCWSVMDRDERFVFNKLMTGGFRVGVSSKLLTRALAEVLGRENSEIAYALMGNWKPQETAFRDLIESGSGGDLSKPYPYCLAHPIERGPADLGDPELWSAEWKWDGIRGQFILREGQHFVWTRGEELTTDKFPELELLKQELPDGTVIDGEILAFKDDKPLGFQVLQTRIGRKKVSRKQLEEAPVSLMAYDLLEHEGEDIRDRPFEERRKLLEGIAQKTDRLLLSPTVEFKNWSELAQAREGSRDQHSEGLMIKRKDAPYEVGRKRGVWWKWKVDPMNIDAVMIYAQRGHGRRANLYSDYTFAVWKGDELVPFAKAYSGLTDKEMARVDAWIKKNTLERFGPVRSVKAELVFEIGFEGIQESKRHKSGIALRFPRILRWREDKKAKDANTLEDLRVFLPD